MYKLVVLSSVLALVAAKPSGLGALGLAGWGGLGAPWGAHLAAPWGAHLAAPWGAHLAGPLASPLAAPVLAAPLAHAAAPVGVAGPTVVAAAPLHGAAYNYRGPVSLAPGQPASILATDGRPLDTLSVNADRAVHYTARAVDQANGVHAHHLGKRSAPLIAPAAWSHAARIDYPAAALAAPLAFAPAAGHLGWRAPIAPLGLGYLGHHW